MEECKKELVFDAESLKQLIESIKDGEIITIYPVPDSRMDNKQENTRINA